MNNITIKYGLPLITAFIVFFALFCGPKPSEEARFLNHYQAGDNFMQDKKYKTALKQFRKALKIQDKNPKLYRQMALCFENLDQTDSAVTYYEGAIVFNPKDSDAYQRIGDIYFNNGMPHVAMTWYDRAQDLGYLYAESYIRLGKIHAVWKEYDWAIRYYEYAATVDSTNMESYYSLGLIYLIQKDTLRALAHFSKAADFNRRQTSQDTSVGLRHANSVYILGLINYKIKNYDEALKWFNSYLQVEPSGDYSQKAKDFIMTIKLKKKAEGR